MTKEIYRNKTFSLTQFYGGKNKGISLQITQTDDDWGKYIQLNKKQLNVLIKEIELWLKENEKVGTG